MPKKPATPLTVHNLTRNTALVSHGRIADNRWTRLKGLIGVKHLPHGDGLLITPCKGVHCLFMSIPIDVLYLDDSNTVIALDHSLAPWRIGRIHPKCRSVLELPAGALAHTHTQTGDSLHISP